MSEKPKIYAHCPAGCNWETIHREDFLKSAAVVKLNLTEAAEGVAPARKYKIHANSVKEQFATLSATLPTGLRDITTLTIGSKVYLFGGSNNRTKDFKMSVFDTETEQLTELSTTLPETFISGSYAAAYGSKIYFFVAASPSASNWRQILVYDTETEEFSYKGGASDGFSMDYEYGNFGAATIGSKVYLFGGENSGDDCGKEIRIFDMATETLVLSSAVLPVDIEWITAEAVGTKIYLFGGYVGVDPVATVYVFDTETETVTTLSATLTNGRMNMGHAAIGTKIYLFGGSYTEPYNHLYSTIDVFDTETEQFIDCSMSLPSTVRDMSAAAVGTKVYLFGGDTSLDATSPLSNAIYKVNPDMRDCLISLDCGNGEHYLPVPLAYDKYCDYFVFEIIALQLNDAKTDLTIAYEVKGKRNIVTVSGANIDLTACKLRISGANEIYVYNPDATINANDLRPVVLRLL